MNETNKNCRYSNGCRHTLAQYTLHLLMDMHTHTHTLRERERTYTVVKDCRSGIHDGKSDALNELLLMSLQKEVPHHDCENFLFSEKVTNKLGEISIVRFER